MPEAPEGTTYLNFETFMEVDLRVGKITNVEDHPNADRLYVVTIDDGTEGGRTICAGLKAYYSAEEMQGKSVVFVANLKPRPLRGVVSEGMMLAADDGNPTFLRAKITTAKFYIEQTLPQATALHEPVKAGAGRLMEMDNEDFARA